MCIATRNRFPEERLLRVVSRGEGSTLRVVPDPQRRMSGRGAWITPTIEAWELAQKRRAFSRALKVSTTVDAGPVRDYLDTLEEDDRQQRPGPLNKEERLKH
ncbi:YlxR family protein [Corynebacterium sp. TAE3-ERU12]|uniref:YlxR family protein n=1 Tax=Corynebacterium sp. TAE3-ERU12 TaxID=2849491 RepID=UPI001C446DB0|nr:YlxR family protein [Corynebacterium sp. TAE3-ERU12]MBV7295244.1 YlxR family protein [Corynebacterium sp. TAE3-ERU12]